jgi:hypothetical protein
LNKKSLVIGLALVCMIALGSGTAVVAETPPGESVVSPLVTLPDGAYGSTIGPGGALYVTQPATGKIWRIAPKTGEVSLFASGLPISVLPFGGVVDVAFIGRTAYALVTLVVDNPVSEDLTGEVVGIYKVTGEGNATPIADIGKFSLDNPPTIPFDYVVPTGVQYAMHPYWGGFLVTDGHLNRVLRVKLDGEVSELIGFGNIVPTGLDVLGFGTKVYMAQAGAIPHAPEDGKVSTFRTWSFRSESIESQEVASGTPLPVDVEFGRGRQLYVLSQGVFPESGQPADPAEENTGALVKVERDGTFSTMVDGLNRPNSLEFIGNTAYVVTLNGEILKIDNVSGRASDD